MSLQAFIDDPNEVDLTEAVHAILQAPESLTAEQVLHLIRAIAPLSGSTEVEYGANFDMKSMITTQMQLVAAMRRTVMDEQGRALPGTDARDLKEVVTASTTLVNTLMKSHKEIMNYDRQRAIEEATVAAVNNLPEEAKQAFFKQLEENLGEIR